MTVVFSLVTFGLVVALVPAVTAGGRPQVVLLQMLPGVRLAFQLEPLGMLFSLVASGLWIPTSLYAFGYMRAHHEIHQTRFYACFGLAIFAALGIAFSGNMLTLFLFYEMLTFSTYPLVAHHQDAESKRGARIYLGILVFTSVAFLLLGIIWTWMLAGTLDFVPGGILRGKASDAVITWLLVLYAFGTGKAALMPFHRWLPNAMVAPTPVSALLHAVAVVKAGVFTILKVVIYIFGIKLLADIGGSDWLKVVAAITLLTASVIAVTRDNLKARLAYSTISQLAYIVLGAALVNSAGILGAGMHIAMHAMGKITLFFCAGAIFVATGKKRVSELDGIGRKMPFTMGAFFLASLSIIGLPPTGGVWSKWFLALGAADNHEYIYVAVYMISSLLTIAYLMPIVGRAFFVKPPADEAAHGMAGDGPGDGPEHATGHGSEHATGPAAREPDRTVPASGGGWLAGIQEAPLLCVAPLCLTALGCIGLFFFADHVYALLLPLVEG